MMDNDNYIDNYISNSTSNSFNRQIFQRIFHKNDMDEHELIETRYLILITKYFNN